VAKGAEPVFCPSPISILRTTSTPPSRNFFNHGALPFFLLDWRCKLVEFVRIKDSGLQPDFIASGFNRRLSYLDSPLKFLKLGNLVAMLCLQRAVYELLPMNLGNSRETCWGRHKGLSSNRVERFGIARQGVPLLLRHLVEAINRSKHQADFPRVRWVRLAEFRFLAQGCRFLFRRSNSIATALEFRHGIIESKLQDIIIDSLGRKSSRKAQQKLEFDRYRTAIAIVERMREAGISCELSNNPQNGH
jgi:hypothetical protein